MPYPPIYHLCCTICHASALAVGGFDPRYACPTCQQLDLAVQVDWPRPAGWMVTHVFARDRTPWIDAPGHPLRLFPVQVPADFLARLAHAATLDQTYPITGRSFAAPGLCRTRTLHHTPWCPGTTQPFALCDEQCQDHVTYAPVAVTTN